MPTMHNFSVSGFGEILNLPGVSCLKEFVRATNLRVWIRKKTNCCDAECDVRPISLLTLSLLRLKLSGKSPVDIRIPPLRIKIMLESNPLQSIVLIRRLAVHEVAPWREVNDAAQGPQPRCGHPRASKVASREFASQGGVRGPGCRDLPRRGSEEVRYRHPRREPVPRPDLLVLATQVGRDTDHHC